VEEVGKMRLSIVVIALNEEDYISNLLDSLKIQTFKDFEVILVDGQSTDKTVDVAKKYSQYFDLNIIVADKRGTGYQRNLGVKNSKYEDVVFFDADNVLPVNFLEKTIEFVENNKADCITGIYKPLEPSLYTKVSMFIHNIYVISQKKRSPVATGTFMYFKKSVFNDVNGFDETILYGEDSDIVKRAVEKGYKFEVMENPKSHFSLEDTMKTVKLLQLLE